MDRDVSFAEILQFFRNMYKKNIVANLLDLRHYEAIQKENPDYTRVNQYGQPMKVDALIESMRDGLRYAKRDLAIVEELMEADTAGTLDEKWSDEAIKKSEIIIPKSEIVKE